MKHYQTTRGWRNNNPLNIRRGEDWTGLASKQTDKAFCQFLNMSYGYRAGAKLLKSYARIFAQHGQQWSVENVIKRWAPPSENDTGAYLHRVLELMHRLDDKDTCMAPLWTKPGVQQAATMLAAMTCVECGCPPSAVPVASINTGFIFAGLSDPHLPSDWY